MNVRIVIKKQNPRDARLHPPTGLVWFENGNPKGVAELQVRASSKRGWVTVEVVDE